MRLSDLTDDGDFIRIVEVFPPSLPYPNRSSGSHNYDVSFRFEQLAEEISRIENIADAFSIPELRDSQRIHLNSVGIATELKKRTGIDIVPTLTLRDSNRQNLLSMISFAFFAGLENILVVRGDPYPNEDNGGPKNVFDIKKISSFVSTARELETNLSSENEICILSPINLLRSSDLAYLKILKQREKSGVNIFLAEQMFEDLDRYVNRLEEVRKSGIVSPVIHSIFPFKSLQDALYCTRKFGWRISQIELENLKKQGAGYGLEMARRRYRFLVELKDEIQGVSISTRGNPEVARFIVN
jgi:5,10-methylenetetrahydrofolate reductase